MAAQTQSNGIFFCVWIALIYLSFIDDGPFVNIKPFWNRSHENSPHAHNSIISFFIFFTPIYSTSRFTVNGIYAFFYQDTAARTSTNGQIQCKSDKSPFFLCRSREEKRIRHLCAIYPSSGIQSTFAFNCWFFVLPHYRCRFLGCLNHHRLIGLSLR